VFILWVNIYAECCNIHGLKKSNIEVNMFVRISCMKHKGILFCHHVRLLTNLPVVTNMTIR
jgi:hypothetical protein